MKVLQGNGIISSMVHNRENISNARRLREAAVEVFVTNIGAESKAVEALRALAKAMKYIHTMRSYNSYAAQFLLSYPVSLQIPHL